MGVQCCILLFLGEGGVRYLTWGLTRVKSWVFNLQTGHLLMVEQSGGEEGLSSSELMMYNAVLSMPVLMGLLVITGEFKQSIPMLIEKVRVITLCISNCFWKCTHSYFYTCWRNWYVMKCFIILLILISMNHNPFCSTYLWYMIPFHSFFFFAFSVLFWHRIEYENPMTSNKVKKLG